MANRLYKRLPGRASNLLLTFSLWEADDHLLQVESSRVSESYRRFFYRDIQAITICQTKTWLIRGCIVGAIALLLGGWAAVSEPVVMITVGILAGLLLIAALWDLLSGPTCRCTLRTAVQTQHLRSLKRLRKTRRVLRRLEPRITTAQTEAAAR